MLHKGEHAGVPRKMVMNVGQNPTVNTQDAPLTVEVHVMHDFGEDLYGELMRVVVTGFIRCVALPASGADVHMARSSHAVAHTTAGTRISCRQCIAGQCAQGPAAAWQSMTRRIHMLQARDEV